MCSTHEKWLQGCDKYMNLRGTPFDTSWRQTFINHRRKLFNIHTISRKPVFINLKNGTSISWRMVPILLDNDMRVHANPQCHIYRLNGYWETPYVLSLSEDIVILIFVVPSLKPPLK